MFHITLENCAFIHLVNVFFCTASCSSVQEKKKKKRIDCQEHEQVDQKWRQVQSAF